MWVAYAEGANQGEIGLNWDIEADVLVLGSGGAALTAALAAHDHGAGEVLILEKSNMVGGTTAMSGGMLWVPNNHHQAEADVEDSWDDVITYLDTLAPGLLDPEVLEGFLDGGPEMVRYLADRTPVKLRTLTGFPDYQPDVPGALSAGGRSLDNDVFSFDQLGNWASRVVPPKTGAPRMTSYHEDMNVGPLDDETLAARRADDSRGRGQALVGGLLKAVLDRDLQICFEHRAMQLHQADGRICGVTAQTPEGDVRCGARKAVVIATGGFEWNDNLVKTFLRGPMTGPVTVPESEGDGLLMAMEVGAKLGNMSNAFWMPSTLEWQQQHRDAKPNFLLCQSERTLPGSILVNRCGHRFVNEAVNYNELGLVLHAYDSSSHGYRNLPFYLVFDERFRSRYPLFGRGPDQPLSESVHRADSLLALASSVGIDAQGLLDTVARFNEFVAQGRDADFGRGETDYDRYWGDRSFDGVQRTLGTLEEPPFYAVRMEAGVLGTNGGPKTNGNAQVLDWQDQPIPGLYCAGNAMAAPLATVYGGGGGTLGPALTFGYLAGRHIAS